MAFSDPTLRNCHVCGREAPTWALTYRKNIGIIAMHWRWTHEMQVCRGCVHREYWKRFAVLVTIGWTSYYSIVIGPVFLIMNTVTYVRALAGKPTATPSLEAPRAAAAGGLPSAPPPSQRQLPPSV